MHFRGELQSLTSTRLNCFFRKGICAEAGVTNDEWVENEYYKDEQTVAIVAAGAKALGVSVGNIECRDMFKVQQIATKHACGSICIITIDLSRTHLSEPLNTLRLFA